MQRGGIHAVAKSCRFGAVRENVPHMRVAERAFYLCSQRAHAEIFFLEDVLPGDGFPEARPTRAGVEFRFRIEERIAAIDAAVQPRRMLIVERTEKGQLGRGALQERRTPSVIVPA